MRLVRRIRLKRAAKWPDLRVDARKGLYWLLGIGLGIGLLEALLLVQ